jgi:hypothetical protein
MRRGAAGLMLLVDSGRNRAGIRDLATMRELGTRIHELTDEIEALSAH